MRQLKKEEHFGSGHTRVPLRSCFPLAVSALMIFPSNDGHAKFYHPRTEIYLCSVRQKMLRAESLSSFISGRASRLQVDRDKDVASYANLEADCIVAIMM